MNPIYTAGYSGHKLDQLKAVVEETGALVVDIRMSARSRIPEWNQSTLVGVLGDNYRHLPEWGNANFKSGPIELQNPPLGLAWVIRWARVQPVILLCGCRDYRNCHRHACAYLLRERGIVPQELAWPSPPFRSGKVRCISLWQPWASLVALGFKKIETRHWEHSYRGPILIHAAKTLAAMKELFDEEKESLEDPFGECFRFSGMRRIGDLPYGALVCVADLVDCVPSESLTDIGELERAFGNYEPDRFGWILQNVRPFPQPIPLRGQQGFWDVDIDLEAALGGVEGAHQEPKIEHHCHARDCTAKVPPKMLMCARHWRMVPRPLQREVWRHYVPGQEIKKNPTREYVDVMKRAIEAVAQQEEAAKQEVLF